MLPSFEENCERIANATNLEDLRAVVNAIRSDYGLAHIVYHALHLPRAAKPNPILLSTYDPEWVRHYIAQDYFRIDPVVQGGFDAFLPMDWTDLDRSSAERSLFFREADRFGVGRNGMTFPIRGVGGERALLSITSFESPAAWKRSRLVYMREFLLIGQFLHDRAVQLAALREPGLKRQLSVREQESLQLAARGLAPKQIAADLQVSSTAVRLYLQSARAKLECATLTQGIAKAVSFDIIRA